MEAPGLGKTRKHTAHVKRHNASPPAKLGKQLVCRYARRGSVASVLRHRCARLRRNGAPQPQQRLPAAPPRGSARCCGSSSSSRRRLHALRCPRWRSGLAGHCSEVHGAVSRVLLQLAAAAVHVAVPGRQLDRPRHSAGASDAAAQRCQPLLGLQQAGTGEGGGRVAASPFAGLPELLLRAAGLTAGSPPL